METLFVLVVAILAGFFLYKNFKKTGVCGCGKKDCRSKKHN